MSWDPQGQGENNSSERENDWEPTLLPPMSRNEEERAFWDEMTESLVAKGQGPASLAALRQRLQKDSPTKPSPSSLTVATPNKGDLYSTGELESLLATHQQMVASSEPNNNDDGGDDEDDDDKQSFGSLHDMVSQMTTKSDKDDNAQTDTAPSSLAVWETLSEETKQRIQRVRAIASDVDGTILTSEQTIHPRTVLGIQRAVEVAQRRQDDDQQRLQYFFPATGKSRKGALDSLGPVVGSLLQQSPGVFLQGLYCVDGNGNVIFEQRLETAAVQAAEALVQEYNVSIIAYDGDDLYTTQVTQIVKDLHETYGEPLPVLLPSTPSHGDDDKKGDDPQPRPLSSHAPRFHKILILDSDTERLTRVVRPALQHIAETTQTRVTQAQDTMLELLPGGCSKALGVAKVCQHLRIDPSHELLAMGDAENDAELLQMASLGICMGNGSPVAKTAADFVLEQTNNQGGVGVALEVFGGIWNHGGGGEEEKEE